MAENGTTENITAEQAQAIYNRRNIRYLQGKDLHNAAIQALQNDYSDTDTRQEVIDYLQKADSNNLLAERVASYACAFSYLNKFAKSDKTKEEQLEVLLVYVREQPIYDNLYDFLLNKLQAVEEDKSKINSILANWKQYIYYENSEFVLNILVIADDLGNYKEKLNLLKQYITEYNSLYNDNPNATNKGTAEDVLTVTLKHLENGNIIYPTDKLTYKAFNLLAGNQENISLAMEHKKKGKTVAPVDVLYSINFDELTDIQISKRLTAKDKRVFIAACNLYLAGNEVMSATQIYKTAYGTDTNPGKALADIDESMQKMMFARVDIDFTQQLKQYKKTGKGMYTSYFMPAEMVSVSINGVTTNAYHILAKPAVWQYAETFRQITTIPNKFLDTPLPKTDKNLAIEDYINREIFRYRPYAKAGNKPENDSAYNSKNASFVMRYNKLCDTLNITERKERVLKPIEEYLNFRIKDGTIIKYTKTDVRDKSNGKSIDTKFTIYLPKT